LLFSGPLVRAILDGRKTQTRRLKFSGKTGDRVWVRETWACSQDYDGQSVSGVICESDAIWYRASIDELTTTGIESAHGQWRPSIFLPRWASRITLDVLAVREEPLQAITEEDARAEGVELAWPSGTESDRPLPASHLFGFRHAWDKLNGKRAPWASNPTVKVVTFKVVP